VIEDLGEKIFPTERIVSAKALRRERVFDVTRRLNEKELAHEKQRSRKESQRLVIKDLNPR
jgi:hypothetical protein